MTYFVSGHRDLTEKEFEEFYVPILKEIIDSDSFARFVVGDWEGCDAMFIKYMVSLDSKHTISIYCVEEPRSEYLKNIIEQSINWIGYHPCLNYDKCDESMTRDSDFDVAWIRPGREDSHTAKNIKRRYNL